MAYDSVKLRSPSMDISIIDHIEQQCLRRSGVVMATGVLKYEIYSGELDGSWDSRISVMPKYEEYVIGKSGRPELQDCEPYVLIEASVHKIFLGHNVYGGPTDFRKVCGDFIELVGALLEVDFLPASYWTVHRVDVAHTFRLSMQQCKEFFQGIQLVSFPRRSKGALKTNMSFHFPGKTTTVKGYHKGSEFRVHERSRLRRYFDDLFMYLFVKGDARRTGSADVKKGAWVDRRLEALQRLADKTLRLEVGINSDKFQYDFGKNPLVSEVTDAYLEGVYDREIEKLLREGKQGMDTVRKTTAVLQRLKSMYGDSNGMRLYGFWNVMSTLGDEFAKNELPKATFYRSRKLLEDAGVSWRGTDVAVVANDGALPADFSPVRTDKRLRYLPARNRDEYQVSRKMLQAA
ncbi:MAG: phage/plasmid replication protein, II/X family [Telluria sp.]